MYGRYAYVFKKRIEKLRKINIPLSQKRCNLPKSKAVECLWAQNKAVINFFVSSRKWYMHIDIRIGLIHHDIILQILI